MEEARADRLEVVGERDICEFIKLIHSRTVDTTTNTVT